MPASPGPSQTTGRIYGTFNKLLMMSASHNCRDYKPQKKDDKNQKKDDKNQEIHAFSRALLISLLTEAHEQGSLVRH